jgi:PAS domain S-box-containing protein
MATRRNSETDRHSAIAEDHLRLVIDTIPAIVWSATPDGAADFVNQRWVEYTGLPLERSVGSGWTAVVHPDDLGRVMDAWQVALTTGEMFEIEMRVRRADGEYRWFLERAVPVRDKPGKIVRWYGTDFDIEDQKRAKEALRRSEAYLAEAQRLSHTGSWVWSVPRRDNTYWSRETYRIFGFDPDKDSCSYQAALDRVHPEDWPMIDQVIERIIREKTDFEIDHRVILPDGTAKCVHSVGRPVTDASGNVVELVGTIIDITEQRQSRRALERAFDEIKRLKEQLQRENLALKEEINQAGMLEEIVGSSEALRRVLVQVVKVAPTDSTVLIMGETGTGKERVARAIHNRSLRCGEAFVRVNCAAIPAPLVASELFGHHGRAAPSDGERHSSHFEAAKRGTIFLDEIGELSGEAQIMLLRVLQEREAQDVGQTAAVDVRVLAATSRDLSAAVDAGTFRRDLYYRMNGFPIQMPPLRQRAEDIPPLVEYLTQRCASRLGKRIKNIEKRTLQLFQAYQWPGNVRELQNVIERAVVLCDGETLSIEETWLRSESPQKSEQRTHDVVTLEDREREAIESVLAASGGRVSGPDGAAAKLGIPRSTLESKIKSLGIKKHHFKVE